MGKVIKILINTAKTKPWKMVLWAAVTLIGIGTFQFNFGLFARCFATAIYLLVIVGITYIDYEDWD